MPIKDIEQTVCLKTASNQQSKCKTTRKENANIVHNILKKERQKNITFEFPMILYIQLSMYIYASTHF